MAGIGSAFTLRLLADAGVGPGQRVLDVGCGGGDVSLMAAGLVGEAGEVVGIDRDAAPLAAARDRAAGLPNVSFHRADLGALPPDLGLFDAVIGRRVLMYLPDAPGALRGLAQVLKPGGLAVFQEHDSTQTPMRLQAMPLHETAQGWVRRTVEREGADLAIGFHLHGLLAQANFTVEEVRAEAIVQTPSTPYPLGWLVKAMLPRILEQGVATAEEIGPDTLEARLEEERLTTGATYLADLMFGAWARRPG